jgi:hypothetical protein
MEEVNRVFKKSLIGILVFQLIGCGTLLYPERRGLKAGHLDVGVVILDAIGLLFFLIPGIIAFAVDFSSGCIYLPASGQVKLKKIKFDPKNTNLADIENIIKNETGHTVKLTQSNMRITKLKSQEEMTVCFAKAALDSQNNLLALFH